MEMTIYTTLPSLENFKGFDNNLANAIWSVSVYNAPRDTGNLQRNISMIASTEKRISILYNAFNAPYLHYLEEGLGPIKKHKGYIEDLTMIDVFSLLILYYKRGLGGVYTRPNVVLGTSKYGAMFSEKKLLKDMGQSLNTTLSADERMSLGRIYSRSKIGSNQKTSRRGMQVNIPHKRYKNVSNRTFDLFYTSQDLY